MISRVNRIHDKHWVYQFCKWLGIPRINVHLCLTHAEKGPIAASLHLTHYVDNDERCLQAVATALPDCDVYYYDNRKMRESIMRNTKNKIKQNIEIRRHINHCK